MEVICLDVGDKRIGVARANTIARLPEPLLTVGVDGTEVEAIQKITSDNNSQLIVIGMPRNLSGEKTQQSAKVEDFSDRLQKSLGIKIVFQDESLTTKKAEELLEQHAKRNSTADIDQMAAVVILKDYLESL